MWFISDNSFLIHLCGRGNFLGSNFETLCSIPFLFIPNGNDKSSPSHYIKRALKCLLRSAILSRRMDTVERWFGLWVRMISTGKCVEMELILCFLRYLTVSVKILTSGVKSQHHHLVQRMPTTKQPSLQLLGVWYSNSSFYLPDRTPVRSVT